MALPPVTPVHFGTSRSWSIAETVARHRWEFHEHRHAGYCDLMLVCEGCVANVIHRQRHEHCAGTLVWVREADWHGLSGSDIRFFNINVREEVLHTLAIAMGEEKRFLMLKDSSLAPAVALTGDFARLEEDVAELHRRQDEPVSSLLLQPVLVRILAMLITSLVQDEHRLPEELPAWLRKGMAYAEAGVDRGVTLGELVNACGRSGEHVSRSFTRHLGVSPSAWLNRQRLARAALLLSSTNREITAICYGLGFHSASYFYRLFRQAYGLPPLQYRRKTNPFRG